MTLEAFSPRKAYKAVISSVAKKEDDSLVKEGPYLKKGKVNVIFFGYWISIISHQYLYIFNMLSCSGNHTQCLLILLNGSYYLQIFLMICLNFVISSSYEPNY